MARQSARQPRSRAHGQLGRLLRQARLDSGRSTRSLGFSAGHISNVEGGHVTPSRDLVEVYIRLGADRAHALALLDIVRQQRRTTSPTYPAPDVLAADVVPADISQHYVIRRHHTEVLFDGIGAITHVVSTIRLAAASRGVRFLHVGHGSQTGAAEVTDLQVSALSGAELERVDVGPTGAYQVYLRLDRVLDPGDGDHTVTVRFEPRRHGREESVVTYGAHSRHATYALRLVFADGFTPQSVWWHSGANIHAISMPQPDDRVAPSASGIYEHRFDDVIDGWLYGLVWVWPER